METKSIVKKHKQIQTQAHKKKRAKYVPHQQQPQKTLYFVVIQMRRTKVFFNTVLWKVAIVSFSTIQFKRAINDNVCAAVCFFLHVSLPKFTNRNFFVLPSHILIARGGFVLSRPNISFTHKIFLISFEIAMI